MLQAPAIKGRFTKFRKQRNTGMAKRGHKVSFGEYGLKSIQLGQLTARQIEAARRVISRYMKRGGKIWIRVFPDKPITKKPLEVRQGSGKGSIEYYVALVQPGRVVFEIGGVSRELAQTALRLAAYKLPCKVVFVERTVM